MFGLRIAVALLFAATGPAAEQAARDYRGSWYWENPQLQAQRVGNRVTVRFEGGDRLRYCYNGQCWSRRFETDADGWMRFSIDGRNRIELRRIDADGLTGRAWNAPPRGGALPPPDAAILLRRRWIVDAR